MKVTVAVLDKNGDSVVTRVLDALQSFDAGQVSHFGVVTPKRCVLEKPLGIINRQGLETSAMLGYISSRPAVSSNYEFQQLGDTAAAFEGRIYKPLSKTALTEQLGKTPSHCEASLQTLIEQADGDYAFWMLREGWIAAGRDPIGVQPLYYGENRDVAAYATNKTALWQLGIEEPQSFPPGTLGFADKDGFKFKPVRTLSYNPPRQVSLDEAADQLLTLLTESLRRRVAGLEKAAVAFSGGLDSSLVAFLAKKLGVKVQLLHVSLENQPETEEAIQAAEALDLPMSVHLFKDSDVEAALPHVVELIEEADPVKAAIGVPFYWTAQKAAEAKYRAVLAGQGADELFGGYQRYVNEHCSGGAEKVARTMFGDVINIHQSNLERDLKITGSFDVELRLPFACYELAEFALGLPVECKIEAKADTLRKLVLRKAAQNAGVPSLIVVKPKKAVQYSTGINDAVKRIAKLQDKTVGDYVAGLFERTKSGV
ncbi:MAG: asparagine synthetase B [Candidatus Bathyarchaeota archaeon]|nr:asparagine synthetase B [Candidatus Bathyarchaeota archaeon]